MCAVDEKNRTPLEELERQIMEEVVCNNETYAQELDEKQTGDRYGADIVQQDEPCTRDANTTPRTEGM
jgi:hypothetical protein